MTDFGFLRARRRPAPAAPVTPSTSEPVATQGNPAVADFLSGRAVRPGREAAAPARTPAAPTPPVPSPAPPVQPISPPAAPAPPASTGDLLDLGSSDPAPPAAASPTAPSPGGNLLDLGSSDPTPTPAPTRAYAPMPTGSPTSGAHPALVSHDLGLPTITAGERRILTVDDPVVHLTRTQSAAGALEFTAATAQPNQLLLGCAFETADQRESMVLPGLRPQGPDPQSPIFRSTPQGATINLRAITGVRRFFLIGLPQTGDRSMPGGTLVIRTYGDARLEVVLDTSATYGAKALVTGFVVEGRIVLRAEHDPFSGTLQQVAGVYGYDQLTWRDPFTPLF